jgi:hypothetical protein
MGTVRDTWPTPRARDRRRFVLIMSAYECHPEADRRARACWNDAREQARSGNEVWIVTATDSDPACKGDESGNLRILVWQLPRSLAALKRSATGRWLHRRLWHWHVSRAIADWQTTLGIAVIQRHADDLGSFGSACASDETAAQKAVNDGNAHASMSRCALTQPRASYGTSTGPLLSRRSIA